MNNADDSPPPPNNSVGHQDLSGFYAATKEFVSEFNKQTHDELHAAASKTIGTRIEHKFKDFLAAKGIIRRKDGSSAKGIDLPTLNIDIKTTLARKAQSSSPFTSFKQKIEGLGYSLILFGYEKTSREDGYFRIRSVRFIPKERTADFTTTKDLLNIINDNRKSREAKKTEIVTVLVKCKIPGDKDALMQYAEWLLDNPPTQGHVTVTNVPQWRLKYHRIVTKNIEGVVNLDPENVPDLPAGAKASETVVDPLIDEE